MKIGLINGSPKSEVSNQAKPASSILLRELRKMLGEAYTYCEVHCKTAHLQDHELSELWTCDTWIISFPLYVDGIPSQLLHSMQDICNRAQVKPLGLLHVYAMVNNGFYEPEQCRLSLEMMEHWCDRCGFIWGQGLAVGAGPMLQATENVPMGSGTKKTIGLAMREFCENICAERMDENLYAEPNLPRFAYKVMAHRGWKSEARQNGITL